MFVMTKKFMSRHFSKAEKYEKNKTATSKLCHDKEVGCNKFYVATQDTPVAIRTRLQHQNYVVTLSNSIVIEFKKKLRKPVATKTAGYDRS